MFSRTFESYDEREIEIDGKKIWIRFTYGNDFRDGNEKEFFWAEVLETDPTVDEETKTSLETILAEEKENEK